MKRLNIILLPSIFSLVGCATPLAERVAGMTDFELCERAIFGPSHEAIANEIARRGGAHQCNDYAPLIIAKRAQAARENAMLLQLGAKMMAAGQPNTPAPPPPAPPPTTCRVHELYRGQYQVNCW